MDASFFLCSVSGACMALGSGISISTCGSSSVWSISGSRSSSIGRIVLAVEDVFMWVSSRVEVVEYGKSCDLINVCGLVFNSETVVCGSYFGSVLLRRNANRVIVRCGLM